MRKLLILVAIMAVFGLTHCATDVLVTTATTAEGRKQEAEQAAETKQKILEGMEENRKKLEERKKQMEEEY